MVQDDGTCGVSYSQVSKSLPFPGSLVQPAAGMGFGRGDTPVQRQVFAAPSTVIPRGRGVRSPLDMAVAADMYAESGRNILGAIGSGGRRRLSRRYGGGDALRMMHASHIARGRI